MPRYQFDWILRDQRILDPEWTDLPNDEAARRHAETHVGLLAVIQKQFGDICFIEVRDIAGRVLFRLSCDKGNSRGEG